MLNAMSNENIAASYVGLLELNAVHFLKAVRRHMDKGKPSWITNKKCCSMAVKLLQVP